MNTNLKNNITKQKEKERNHLEILCTLFHNFPDGVINPGRDRPNFFVESPNGKIGIEHTLLFKQKRPRDKPSQAQESECQQMVMEALKCYEKMNLPITEVSLSFGTDTSFNKKNRKKFAKILTNLIVENLPADNSWLRLKNDYLSPTTFPFEIHSVRIARYNFLINNFWFVSGFGCVQKDFYKELQDII